MWRLISLIPAILLCGIQFALSVDPPAESKSSGDSPTPLSEAAAQMHVKTFCVECHRQGRVKGQMRLDLPIEQMKEIDWQKIVQVLHHSDMPPEKAAQPSKDVRRRLEAWAQSHLDKHILKRAGDPGAVAWRRLTAIELDNMIRDLTGRPFPASRHFPTENFGGEGFSNVGNVQIAMSGPVLDKYLAMADEVAKHARFDADGKLAFDAPGAIVAPEVRQDRTLVEIKLIGRIACGELYLGPGRRIGGEAGPRRFARPSNTKRRATAFSSTASSRCEPICGSDLTKLNGISFGACSATPSIAP